MTYDEKNASKARAAKVRSIAIVMVMKWHAGSLSECYRQLSKNVIKYARTNKHGITTKEFGPGLLTMHEASSAHPRVLCGHDQLADVIDDVDGATPEEIVEAYELAISDFGLPDTDEVRKLYLFR